VFSIAYIVFQYLAKHVLNAVVFPYMLLPQCAQMSL
jgi:hypothetical protein